VVQIGEAVNALIDILVTLLAALSGRTEGTGSSSAWPAPLRPPVTSRPG
jgi:hypothetical protein